MAVPEQRYMVIGSTGLPVSALPQLPNPDLCSPAPNEHVGGHQPDFGHVQDLSLQDQDKENFAPSFTDICWFALSLLLIMYTAIPLTFLKYQGNWLSHFLEIMY